MHVSDSAVFVAAGVVLIAVGLALVGAACAAEIGPHAPLESRLRGVSSVGRAPALQAGGRRFEPGTLHSGGAVPVEDDGLEAAAAPPESLLPAARTTCSRARHW